MTDNIWEFTPTHKFALAQAVETVDTWPEKVYGGILMQGQRSTKNKKGLKVFDCNSYQIVDGNGKLHYFLETDLK